MTNSEGERNLDETIERILGDANRVGTSPRQVWALEQFLGLSLPAALVQLALHADEASLRSVATYSFKSLSFDLYAMGKTRFEMIGAGIRQAFKRRSWPSNRIIPIGKCGNGDEIALDYRSGAEPTVLFFDHEQGDQQPIRFQLLALSFAELLNRARPERMSHYLASDGEISTIELRTLERWDPSEQALPEPEDEGVDPDGFMSDLACSSDGILAAGAGRRSRGVIFDPKTGESLAHFPLPGDRLSHSLLVLPEKAGVVVGGGQPGGVVCYSASGDLLWQRPDLRGVRTLKSDANGKRLVVGFHNGPVMVLDPADCSIVEVLAGASEGWPGDGSEMILGSGETFRYRTATGAEIEHPTGSFAIRDAFIQGEHVWVSAVGGTCKVLHRENGALAGEFDSDEGHHVELFFRGPDDACYGLERNYQDGGTRRVLRFKAAETEVVGKFDHRIRVPVPGTNRMIRWHGEMISEYW